MGVFDNVNDVPGQLQAQALQVALEFQPSVPAAGQGTISWNIPIPDAITSGDAATAVGAYAGILIVVSDQPVAIQNIPKNGVTYVGDPTLDPDLFSGDRIGNARVLASIYQADIIAQGGTPTTSIIVNNVDIAKNYYIAAYIMDAQRRYDRSGSRAYSDRLGAANQQGSCANQTVLLAFNGQTFRAGVLPSDATNLVAGATYQFQLIYDSGYPYGKNTVRNMLITIQGDEAGVYSQLIKKINEQLAIQSNPNTIVSPVAPGQGIFYWSGSQLYYWNGSTLVPVETVITQTTAPASIPLGSFWYNLTTMLLYTWNGTTWVQVPNFVSTSTPPTSPAVGSYWYNSTSGVLSQWNGIAWVAVALYANQTPPPTSPAIGSYWYNPTTMVLSQWNGTMWVAVPNSIVSTTAPSNPTTNQYWYDPTTGVLSQWNGTSWVPVPSTSEVIIQGTDPTNVAVGTYWYNPATGVLAQWNGTEWVPVTYITSTTNPTQLNPPPITTTTTTTETYWFNGIDGFALCGNTWCEQPTIVSPTNPACPILGPTTCAFWYETVPSVLSQWNGTSWTNIPNFVVSTTAPTSPTLSEVWYDPTTGLMAQWNGTTWVNVTNFVVQTTAPANPTLSEFWYNTTIPTLYSWGGAEPWNPAYAITWPTAPNELITGTYWYNSTTDLLYQRTATAGSQTVNFSTLIAPSTTISATNTATATVTVNGTTVIPVSMNLSHTPTIGAFLTNLNTILGSAAEAALNLAGNGIVVTSSLLTAQSSILITDTNLFAQLPSYSSISVGVVGTGTWTEEPVISSAVDPYTLPGNGGVIAGSLWYDPTNESLSVRNLTNTAWDPLTVLVWPTDPTDVASCGLWFDSETDILYIWDYVNQTWDLASPFYDQPTDPFLGVMIENGTLWYDTTTDTLYLWEGNSWTTVTFINYPTPPTVPSSPSYWYDTTTMVLYIWNGTAWVQVSNVAIQTTAPLSPVIGQLWYDPTTMVLSVWNGTTWLVVPNVTISATMPSTTPPPTAGTIWYDPSTGIWYIWGTPIPGQWNVFTPVISTSNPGSLAVGTFWFDTTNNTLYVWNGVSWVVVPFTTTAPTLKRGQVWYNSTNHQLSRWNGTAWFRIKPAVYARLDQQGNLLFETTGRGSNQVVMIPVPDGVPYMASGLVCYGTGAADYINDSNSPYQNYPLGGVGNVGVGGFDIPLAYSDDLFGGLYYDGFYTGLDYFGDFSGFGTIDCWVDFGAEGGARIPYRALPISPNAFLFAQLQPVGNVLLPWPGQDGVSGTPTYDELGVGTTGSPDERRNIMGIVRTQLGYPTVTVELTDPQLDRCVQNALETFRQRSSMAVYRACFFLDIQPFNQHYLLTNKAVGFNKVVDVMAGYRFTSAFLSTAMGAGVYGQVVLQHLYNMGTFDLLSYHLVSQYVEQLEILFATRLTFVWDQNTRKLSFHQSFVRPERILLDVTLEKTEQEIFLDRYAKRWIQQFALAEAMDILAQIRGKYASLPGASGNITLNALDLRTQAKDIRDALYLEIEENIVQDVESYGAYGSFTIG